MRPGDYIDGNQSNSIRVIDNSAFKIMLYVPQSVATKVKAGDRVILKREDGQGIGLISAVSPSVDPKTGSVLTEIIAKNIPKEWISGMYVDIKVPLEVVDNAVAVPVQAILFEESKPFVYVIQSGEEAREPSSQSGEASHEGEKVKKVWIKTKISDSQYIQVTEGIQASDLIVIRGQNLLKDGAKVQIQE